MVLCSWVRNAPMSLSLPHCLNVYLSNLLLIPSSLLPLCSSPPSSSHSLPMSGANISSVTHSSSDSLTCPPFLFYLLITLSFILNLSVCDRQECGEECSEHVRSPKIPLRTREQWGVVLLSLCGIESCPQWPVPVPHLPRWPGHTGLSWSGADQSG